MKLLNTVLVDAGVPYIMVRIAVILLTTQIAAKLFKKISQRSDKNNRLYFKLFRNVAITMIYVAGAIVALSQVPNFEKGVQTLLAGSGIAALTVGLAAQDSLGNAFNGLFISIFKPFEVGDRIRLVSADITGYIEDITLRHTVVRTFVNSRIIVPNSVINKEMIENSNYWDGKASAFIDVTITYDSDLELAREIMANAVLGHPSFVDTRPPDQREGSAVQVFVRALTLYGVDLRVSMWTDSIGNNFDACSDVRRNIKLEFDRMGIKIAHSRNFDPMATPPQ